MSQGKVYADNRIRSVAVAAIVKHFNLDVEVVTPADDKANFDKYFPTGKVPAFVGPKGLKLNEAIAVSIYCMFFLFVLAYVMRNFSFIQLSLS